MHQDITALQAILMSAIGSSWASGDERREARKQTAAGKQAECVEAGANWFLPDKQPAPWNIAAQFARIGLTMGAVLQTAGAV